MARWAALKRRGGVTADSEATTLDLPLFLSEAAALLLHLLLHPLHCRRTSRLRKRKIKSHQAQRFDAVGFSLLLAGFLFFVRLC